MFYAITIAFLAFLLVALAEPLRFTYLAWTPGYEFPTHRVHHVMIGGVLTALVLGVAAQLYRPTKRVGAFLLAVIGIDYLRGGTWTAPSALEPGPLFK